jgi:GNAT superfamily N-acetyltransferase
LAGNEDSFQAVLSSQSVKLIVAESANKIVGFVCFSIRSVFRYPRPIVEVEEIYVTEEHRRKGVATGLIKVVDDFAKETDAYYVFLASDETRKNAHQFYKSLGYDQYAFHFRRKC